MQPAHIEDMDRLFFIVATILLALLILLFLPVYITTDAHYDMNSRKLAFSINAYRFIKLLGGYLATYRGGLAAHVSEKKAILIPYKEFKNEQKRISVVRTFRLKTLKITAETGAEYFLPITIAQSIFRCVFLGMGGKKGKVENNTWLTEGDILRVSVRFTLRFNLFIILRNLFNSIKERI